MLERVIVEKLNNANWALKMKMVLIREDCWLVVKEENHGLVAEEAERLGDKALSLIVLSVENDPLVHVRKSETGREA